MKKFIILLTRLIPEKDQKRFGFLDDYDVTYEYVQEYVDDDRKPIERHLQLEEKGPDSFTYSPEYIAKLQDADVIVSFYSPVPSAAFDNGHVEAVVILRSGVENVDLHKATKAGVKVINAPGRLAVPVAEFTVGLIIAEMKNIARSHHKLMSGEWSNQYPNSKVIFNLKGKNVGLIGCGAIGSRVARVMKAMDANVLIYDPYVPAEQLEKDGYQAVALDELCAQADVISVHFRLTESTENLITEKHFALMKPHAVFINTARAGLVDEAALLDALRSGKISGAGLDVFHEEPLPADSPLLKLNNVTLTPHLAGTSTDLMDLTLDVVVNCITNFLETGKWTNVVELS